MVEDTDTLRRYTPFTFEGFDLFTASTSATKLSFSCSGVNDARPIEHCTMPDLSARYWIWPALAFLSAAATSGVTVPTFGVGISPRGPGIWPSCPTTLIESGLAMGTTDSIVPALIVV